MNRLHRWVLSELPEDLRPFFNLRTLLPLAIMGLVATSVAPVIAVEFLYRLNLAKSGPLPTPPLRASLPSPLREAIAHAFVVPCRSSPYYPWNEPKTLVAMARRRAFVHNDCADVLLAQEQRFRLFGPWTRETSRMPGYALSIWLRRHWTPEQVLVKYVESASFGAPDGQPLLGAEAAAKRFFDLPLEALTPAQAALLAGVMGSGSMHSPWRHPDRALFRRQWILHRMHDAGALDDAGLAAALAAPLGVVGAAEPPPKQPGKPPGPDDPE